MHRMLALLLIACIAVSSAQQACQLTDPDVLGPYYIAGAPDAKGLLCAATPAHDRLVLTGQVLDYDSKCARPIPFAKLDLWQVDEER
jgi:catechol 1,2-dioxygenase